MRTLGIDPGYGTVGWAIVDDVLSVRACGSIETPPGEDLCDRLLHIHRALGDIIHEHKPEHAALERLFFSRNTTTALDVSKAVGVIMLTLRLENLKLCEYTPIQVKQALTGYGRATKGQVQAMVSKILKINTGKLKDDVTDAVAIAACHCLTEGCLRARAIREGVK